ncbi:MAG: hypothetical protein ACT4O2_07555 [Beijerinckiaceae bacterium]
MPHPRVNGIPPKNLPRAERYEAGRELRQRVARETHAECSPASGRDPVAILAGTGGARIPELPPIFRRAFGAFMLILATVIAIVVLPVGAGVAIGIVLRYCMAYGP